MREVLWMGLSLQLSALHFTVIYKAAFCIGRLRVHLGDWQHLSKEKWLRGCVGWPSPAVATSPWFCHVTTEAWNRWTACQQASVPWLALLSHRASIIISQAQSDRDTAMKQVPVKADSHSRYIWQHLPRFLAIRDTFSTGGMFVQSCYRGSPIMDCSPISQSNCPIHTQVRLLGRWMWLSRSPLKMERGPSKGTWMFHRGGIVLIVPDLWQSI